MYAQCLKYSWDLVGANMRSMPTARTVLGLGALREVFLLSRVNRHFMPIALCLAQLFKLTEFNISQLATLIFLSQKKKQKKNVKMKFLHSLHMDFCYSKCTT